MTSSFPTQIITHFMNESDRGILGLKFVKFLKAARIYKVITIVRLVRVFRQQKYIEALLQKVTISPTFSALISNLIKLMFLLHFVGCTWAIVAMLNELE